MPSVLTHWTFLCSKGFQRVRIYGHWVAASVSQSPSRIHCYMYADLVMMRIIA